MIRVAATIVIAINRAAPVGQFRTNSNVTYIVDNRR
jgi:hypothetical protein